MYWHFHQSAAPLPLLLLTYIIFIVQSAEALQTIASNVSNCENVTPLKDYSGLELIRAPKIVHMECVNSLDMSNNELQLFNIESHVIKYLNLADNRLRFLRIWAPELENLYLNNNYLTDVNNLYIPNLKVLMLKGNNIRTISPHIFQVLYQTQFRSQMGSEEEKTNQRKLRAIQCIHNHVIIRINQATCTCFLNNEMDLVHEQLCTAENAFKWTFQTDNNIRIFPTMLRRRRSVTDAYEGSTVSPYKSDKTMPYDPRTGLYTAGTLSGMLVLFLLCMLYYKIKKETKRFYRKWRDKRTLLVKSRMSSIEVGCAISHQKVQAIPQSDKYSSKCTVQLTHIRKLDETRI